MIGVFFVECQRWLELHHIGIRTVQAHKNILISHSISSFIFLKQTLIILQKLKNVLIYFFKIVRANSVAGSRVWRLLTKSMPMKQPQPRMSPITSYFDLRRLNSFKMCSLTSYTCLQSFSFSITSRTAFATAIETGFPPYYI